MFNFRNWGEHFRRREPCTQRQEAEKVFKKYFIYLFMGKGASKDWQKLIKYDKVYVGRENELGDL